jgi:5-methylcytosine-specific restriction endonuclease McrA
VSKTRRGARRLIIGGVAQIDPRHTRAWRRLRDQVVAEEPICALQFFPICTGWSETADHIIAVVDRPDLVMARANLRGACHRCNTARKNRDVERTARRVREKFGSLSRSG